MPESAGEFYEIVADTPGLYQRAGWKSGDAGLYALVIGVSSYDYLQGDQENSYGLGPLFVSALTGFRVFEWLKTSYNYKDKPLQRCWLLLSPSDAELAFEPAMKDAGLPATFDNCENFIADWYKVIDEIEAPADDTRSLFFFSGHGIEVYERRQILLPQDYLKPPVRNVNRALSTFNLSAGMRATKLSRHFFFIDACRNDSFRFRSFQDVDGAMILNVPLGLQGDRAAPIMYASAGGDKAWQPQQPEAGITFFGEALLSGLVRGDEKIPLPDRRSQPPCVPLWNLYEYVNEYMQTLLTQARIDQLNPVFQDGVKGRSIVTDVGDVSSVSGGSRKDTFGFLEKIRSNIADVDANIVDDSPMLPGGMALLAPGDFSQAAGFIRGTKTPISKAGLRPSLARLQPRVNSLSHWLDLNDFDKKHDILRSENVTRLLESGRVFIEDADGKKQTAPAISRAQTSDDSRVASATFALPIDGDSAFIEFHHDEAHIGAALPFATAKAFYRIDITRQRRDGLALQSVQLRLSPQQEVPWLRLAADLLDESVADPSTIVSRLLKALKVRSSQKREIMLKRLNERIPALLTSLVVPPEARRMLLNIIGMQLARGDSADLIDAEWFDDHSGEADADTQVVCSYRDESLGRDVDWEGLLNALPLGLPRFSITMSRLRELFETYDQNANTKDYDFYRPALTARVAGGQIATYVARTENSLHVISQLAMGKASVAAPLATI
jgi:hypothetical protein